MMGRPTKYNRDVARQAKKYVEDCYKGNRTPYIEELALELDLNDDTINEWTKKHSDFSATIDRLKILQRLHLKRGALEKKFQSNIATFLLKANHDLPDSYSVDSRGTGVVILPPLHSESKE